MKKFRPSLLLASCAVLTGSLALAQPAPPASIQAKPIAADVTVTDAMLHDAAKKRG